MGVIGLNALSRLGLSGVGWWGKWRSTDSYRNPQFVTANINELQPLVVQIGIRNAHIKVSFAGQFQSNVYVVAVIQRSRRFIELVRHLVLNCHLHTFRRCGSVILFQNGRYERTSRFFKSNLFLVWDTDEDVTSKQQIGRAHV